MDCLLTELTEEKFYAQGYADNELIIVIGPVFSVICGRMQMAYRVEENWIGEK